nr:hypothetical protein [Tanacetum cinerariifolium]
MAEFEKRQSETVATEEASRAAIKTAINQELDDIQAMIEADNKWLQDFNLKNKNNSPLKKSLECSKLKPKLLKKLKIIKEQESAEDEQEKEELRLCLKIVLDEDRVINYETLAVKSLIIDWETQLLGSDLQGEDLSYWKITRVDGSFRFYKVFSTMLKEFNRQDLFDLH